MQLPEALRRAIEKKTEGQKLSLLSCAAARLSDSYRQSRPAAMLLEIDRVAYLVSRLPATYAATRAVLADICERLPDLGVESALDLGAGPGTAAWAATDAYPGARRLTLVEKDAAMIQLGKDLARESGSAVLTAAKWHVADLTRLPNLEHHDLVLLSYVMSELDSRAALDLLRRAWELARSVLVIVEPGTSPGFARIRLLRDELLQRGAHVVSPCPHDRECPMEGGDWCHFAQRLERTSAHRRVKSGTLGYEDEKYSYIAVSRAPAPLPAARILRHPAHHSGFVELTLCTRTGLREETVSRKQQAKFRRARKAAWGGSWETSTE